LKILVIRFSSIGDIVLCSPVLRCLKNAFPKTEIHFLTKKKFAGLLEFNPHLKKIHALDESLSALKQNLKEEEFDLIIDLHSSLRSRWLCLLLGRPVLSVRKRGFDKWLLVRFGWNRLGSEHVVERYMKTLKPLGIEPDNKGLEFYPCDCEKPQASELPAFYEEGNFAVFSIGGTHFTKRMPSPKWMEFLLKFPCPVILAGGKEDMEEAARIEKAGKLAGKSVFNACGKFTIGGTAHLIRQSKLVISHDTGMMHIAAAFQKPVVCIWGNTVPAFGFYPWKTPHFNLEVKHLTCRPCTRIGKGSCPKGHFFCMEQQDLQQEGLWNFIRQALKD
jgi:ADP-heptose:LPS heptosyltransferase